MPQPSEHSQPTRPQQPHAPHVESLIDAEPSDLVSDEYDGFDQYDETTVVTDDLGETS